jgi:hypothetical protein
MSASHSVVLFFAGLTFVSGPATAGAWLYPEGKGQVIVTTTFADARKAYDAQGRLIETPPYRKFEARAYVEHGLTDWLTFVGEASYLDFRGASSPVDHLNLLVNEAKAGLPLSPIGPPGLQYGGFGIGAAGGRVELYEFGAVIVSMEASLRAAPPGARRFLDMRDTVQADARVLFGRPFEVFGFNGFFDAQFGYRSRGQNGDEIRADVTAGLRPLDQLLLMAQSFSAIAPRGGIATLVAAQKFQLSAVYDVTPQLSAQLGVVSALGGVNSPVERGVISALWWRY